MSSSKQVSLETLDGLQRKITVQLPAEQIGKAIAQKLHSLSKSVRVDGFRPGKVPLKVVEKRFGPQVRQEVLSSAIETSFREAIVEQHLKPAGMPKIETLPPVEEQGFGYAATFEVYPQVEIQELAKVEIEQPIVEITDGDLDEMLENLRKQRLEWDLVERAAANGDRVKIDFIARVEGQEIDNGRAEDYDLVLGSNTMIDGFETQLEGVKAGDQKTLALQFPDTLKDEKLAGKPVEFEVTVKSVAASRLPAIDDALAESFGVKEGGIDKLRQNVRDNMQRELRQTLRQRLKRQVMDGLLAIHDFVLPAAPVQEEIQRLREQLVSQYGKDTDTSMFANDQLFTPEAQRRVKLGLILAEIIKQQKFTVDAATLRTTVEEIASAYEHPEQVINYYYGRRDLLQNVESMVLEDRVVDWVMASAKVNEKPMGFKELMQPQTEATAEESRS